MIIQPRIEEHELFPTYETNTYNDKGNLKQNKDKYYEYNDFNQLIRVRNGTSTGAMLEEYVYDHKGDRIKKIEYLSGGKNNTFYYIGDDFVRKVNSSGSFDTVYYYDGDTLLAKNESGIMYFFHPDHLGSNDLMTDINGNVVEETFYYPFGLILSGGNKENRLFTGKELDSTDLYYYGSRYYDPFMRRFTQADPVIADIYNPQSLNAYSYVLNNPYGYVDPDGRDAILFQGGFSVDIPFAGGTILKGFFVVVDEKTGKVQVGTATTGSGGVGIKKSKGAGANILIGGTVIDDINDYRELKEKSNLNVGFSIGRGLVGIEYDREFIDGKDSGYSLYYSPGASAEAHAHTSIATDVDLLLEFQLPEIFTSPRGGTTFVIIEVPSSQQDKHGKAEPKSGDEEFRSDPKTEKHIEKRVEKRKRTKSERAKEEWKRRYRQVFG